jgi:hypothetical protein
MKVELEKNVPFRLYMYFELNNVFSLQQLIISHILYDILQLS